MKIGKLWRLSALAAALVLLGGAVSTAEEKKTTRDVLSFGALQAPKPEDARRQAQEWLASVGKMDEAKFKAVWDSDLTLLDKVAETLSLGDARAAALLKDARDPAVAVPEGVPALLKDTKLNPYFRSNLALAYARALSNRKAYDEAREALVAVKPELTVDPAAYYFLRALSEYTLMMKKEADESISRLLEDVTDAPERYRMVAALMRFDMLTWQEKDLGWVARKMGIIRDRLELTRGGKKTQAIQKEVMVRLDEMIKELENKQKQQGQGSGQGNGGQCPEGGSSGPPSGSIPSGTPAADSALPSGQMKGEAVEKQLRELTAKWGSLPEKDRAKAMTELTRGMPPQYAEAIKAYFDKLQQGEKAP